MTLPSFEKVEWAFSMTDSWEVGRQESEQRRSRWDSRILDCRIFTNGKL